MVSAVALGLIALLVITTLKASILVGAALAVGWILIPVTLVASLWRPSVRYGLVVPSALVSVGLVAVCVLWLPGGSVAATGWLLMTAGVLLGGAMGLWLWFRVLPVPAVLDDPVSAGRWALIALHVAPVVAGLVLVVAAAVPG